MVDAQELLFEVVDSVLSPKDDHGPCFHGVQCYRVRMVQGEVPTRLSDCRRCKHVHHKNERQTE